MTQCLAAGRLALLLLVTAFAHPNAAYQAINEPPNPSRSAVLEHVTLIVGNGSPAMRDATLFMREGRIVQIAASNTFTTPPDVRRIDATGKFAIPGLWDMHVHLFNSFLQDGSDNHAYFFPLLVANGVVGVRDMYTNVDDVVVAARWNAEIASGSLIGPHVIVSSRGVDGDPPGNPSSLVVHNAAEARQAVRTLKASGAGLVKVLWALSRDAYFAIAEESKAQGIPFGGHVPFAVSAAEASDAGQRTIEHNTGILETCSSKEAEWLKIDQASWTPAHGAEMVRTYDEAKCETLARRFVKNGTWLVPTAANFFDPPDIDVNARRPYVLPAEMERWMSTMKARQASREAPTPLATLRRQRGLQMTQTMRRAGVRFLAGTDLSSRNRNGFVRPSHIPGIGLHDELALLVESGFTPAEALQAASSNAAEYAGQSREFGTLEVGKRADVVLLEANPLEDIRNSRKIHAVILGGRYVSKRELDDMVDRAVGRAP